MECDQEQVTESVDQLFGAPRWIITQMLLQIPSRLSSIYPI